MIYKIFFITLTTLISLTGKAQTVYNNYINKYAGMAVEQMKRHGVPASITLAQGLIESAAGTSRLAQKANNHFGIKVGTTWTGPYMIMADDRPNDKFRVYRSVTESFEDHSLFLRNGSRYAFLFNLKANDYKGWARGLKQAGYATSPTYANTLINTIERYNLTTFDLNAHDSRELRHQQREERKLQNRAKGHTVRKCNSQYYIIAQEGDTYASLARLMRNKEKRLREYNDVDESYALKTGDVVYLGKKQKRAAASIANKYHIMEEGESLYAIAQRYGIRLKSLCKMNPIRRNYRFKVGDKIKIK